MFTTLHLQLSQKVPVFRQLFSLSISFRVLCSNQGTQCHVHIHTEVLLRFVESDTTTNH